MEQENKEQMQKTFDKVATHLLTQNQKASTQDGRCKYRTKDGLKCAIGCLIPDEIYDRDSMEDKNLGHLLQVRPDLKNIPEINGFTVLLTDLQHVHDCKMVNEWPEELKEVAVTHGLNSNVVDEYVKQN